MTVNVIHPKQLVTQRFEDFEVGDVLVVENGNTGIKVGKRSILFLTTDDGRDACNLVCDLVSPNTFYIKPQSAILHVEV